MAPTTLDGVDWLGVPEDPIEGVLPVVQTSCRGGEGGRGLFTTSGRPPVPLELLRDPSFGDDGLIHEDEACEMCDKKLPESEFLVSLVLGGVFGWFRDEFSEGELRGKLRPLREVFPMWLEEKQRL
eukprot:TRINITY_DN12807_c1_g1_i2.p1 TRINITY_DN12807_c1_g1~~TRINITY_DN12807_c1_g1_i2.p1  ORF type:complete len:133 (+),score=19.14 TRINITY_DN12807_c1_g1_i2:22-399(+)